MKNIFNRSKKIKILTIFIVFSFLFSIVPNSVWAAEPINRLNDPVVIKEDSKDLQWIYIFYDPSNENTNLIAQDIHQVLSFRLENIKLIPISMTLALDYWLKEDPWMILYVFNSDTKGIKFPSENLSWEEFYNKIQPHKKTEHIVGLANTLSMENYTKPWDSHIHLSLEEQTDVILLTMYDIWSVSEIIKQKAQKNDEFSKLAEDLNLMATKIYTENFNALFQAQAEPTTSIGEIDPVAAEKRKQDMWDRNQPQIRPAAYIKDENGTLTEIPQDEVTEDFSPLIQLTPKSAIGGDDFFLGEIPLLSGLRGPIGEIVDILLDVLGSGGSTALSLPKEIMETIQESFAQINSIIGIVDNFDMESPLKSIIEALSAEFPFIEELKPYLNLFIKALFNLRGDMSDISSILIELVQTLVGDLLPDSVSGVIGEVLNIGTDLWDRISESKNSGKNIFDTMVSFFTENVLDKILNKTLVATFGIDPSVSNITGFLSRMKSFTKTIISSLISFDVEELLENISGELIVSVVGAENFGDSEENAVNKINSMIQLSMNVVDISSDFNNDTVVSLVKNAAELIIGNESVAGDFGDLASKLMKVVKKYQEEGLPSVDDFKNAIMEKIQEFAQGAIPVSTQLILRDVMTLITGIFNDAFNVNSLPDIFEIAYSILDELSIDTSLIENAINGTIRPLLGIISYITGSDSLKQIMHKTIGSYSTPFVAVSEMFQGVMGFLELDDGIFNGTMNFEALGEIGSGILNLVTAVKGKSFTGVLKALWMSVGSIIGVHPSFDGVPISAFNDLLKAFFPSEFGLDEDDIPDPSEIISTILQAAEGALEGVIDTEMLGDFLNLAMNLKDLFTDGLDWLVGKVLDWLGGLLEPVLEDLQNTIMGLLGGNELLGFHTVLPIGLGEWSLFNLELDLGITANFAIDPSPLFDIIRSLILDGKSMFSLSSIGDFFKLAFSFFEISPQFVAEMKISGLDSSKNSFMQYILETLGVELAFSADCKFLLTLFTFKGGIFEWDNFFKVIEWTFNLAVQMSKPFTLLDFLTGGVGGGVLSKMSKYLGLDAITVTIMLGFEISIVKMAATALAPEISTLSMVITLGAAIHIGLNLVIVELSFDGSLEIILTFFQELGSPKPMKITLRLLLTFKVKIYFLFDSITKKWTWEPAGPWDLSPNPGDSEFEESGVGFDTDGDGLSDEYEKSTAGLDMFNPDTDGDGANDKLEVQTMDTDATDPDTDDDGLLDGEEWEIGTNPLRIDTDWDKLTDYEEVEIYLTNPLSQDTDGDHLSDSYEVNFAWNLTGVTPTVEEVLIGGIIYNDHTDPLNPDIDGDGLVDGVEGPMGAYYGLDSLYNESDSAVDENPLIFFNGYTHPLDSDTDDDSCYQLYNGMVDKQLNDYYLMDMNDGAEVAGFMIIIYDDEGEPEDKHVFTNPCNPDTDGDTGITDRTPQPGMWINSDGYELAQTPPTDPTNGDSDGDGLIDGIEGVLNPYSNHTNPNDSDTDDDGLFDMQEILLGCDPRAADSDFDMISDGDEFYIFHTNPNLFDSDFDGLSDGEEVYIWHSNPMLDDSDGDYILDGKEVLIYGSDPMDEDGDNDGLTDFEEIKIYGTNAFDYDSDDDGLSDGEEVLIYFTDPLNWDTDNDSMTEPNGEGGMTWSMNDYEEVKIYGTNPTKYDSDSDGLSDALELYIASGNIPWFEALALDPNNNDTDSDNLLDGAELQIKNVSDIIYPFVSQTLVKPYNTSAVLSDTDFDSVSDYDEVMIYNSNPNCNDTDFDGISDGDEIFLYNTSAIYNDTDGDGLLDNEELLIPISSNGPQSADSLLENNNAIPKASAFGTDPLNPDSDGDYLPDGAEIFIYETDPLDTDSDNDGIDDTYEFDSDYDGLSDGIEFKEGLQRYPGGGIYNPDSDADGLLDGDEYYIYKTSPVSSDTDGDGYSDGIEVSIGTDPLTYTSKEDFELKLAMARGVKTLDILLPKAGGVVYKNTPVQVVNYTGFQDMCYQYKNGSDWSDNISMIYKPDVQQWFDDSITWTPGNYELKVIGRDLNGSIHTATVTFKVININSNNLFLGIGIGAALALLATSFVIYKRRKGLSGDNGKNAKKGKKGKKGKKKKSAKKSESKITKKDKKGKKKKSAKKSDSKITKKDKKGEKKSSAKKSDSKITKKEKKGKGKEKAIKKEKKNAPSKGKKVKNPKKKGKKGLEKKSKPKTKKKSKKGGKK